MNEIKLLKIIYKLCKMIDDNNLKDGLMNNIINILLSKLFSRCPDCKKWFKHDVKNRKLNTRYENNKYNYLYSCEDCYYEVCRYYVE